jgi:hypothetical protein
MALGKLMNLKKKAKSALQNKKQSAFQSSLADIEAEASTILEDIKFLLVSSGIDVSETFDLDLNGLEIAERYSKDIASENVQVVEQYERLLAILLGQVIIVHYGGKWKVYDGENHTLLPTVIYVDKFNKYLDVFMFCKNFSKKSNGLKGGKKYQALRTYCEELDKRSFK